MIKIIEPIQDATSGEYDDDRKCHFVLDRGREDTLVAVTRFVEMMQKALADANVLEALTSGRP